MRLKLRPEWRPRPIRSFLGFLDLKFGIQVALLFAVINKVAGIYGLVALFTGGSLAQLSMYIYSVAFLFVYVWGIRATSAEDPDKTLIMAHIYLMDHIASTLWTVFFSVAWWSFTAHDGKRVTNSPAQEEVAAGGASYGHHPPILSETLRAKAALELWNEEKNFAAGIIFAGWFIKLYFIMIIYTYALHLRHGTYRALPLSRSVRGLSAVAVGHFPDSESEDEDTHLHDVDDFHQPYPPRANGHGQRYSASKERAGASEVVFDADAGGSSNMSTPKTSR